MSTSGGGLVDEIEHLGRQADTGRLDFGEAAHRLQQYADGGLTREQAARLIADWPAVRARHRSVFDTAGALLRRIEASFTPHPPPESEG